MVAPRIVDSLPRRSSDPPKRLADEYAKRTDVPPDWNIDLTAALTRLITALCAGLLAEAAE